MNLVPGLGLTPQALNSARVALAPKCEPLRRIIERSSMESPVVEKQNPPFGRVLWGSGARLGLTPQALNSARVALAPKGVPLCGE